jgi:hypothetical protein
MSSICTTAEMYQTETYELPPEPPIGTVVVSVPDRGGPFWTRTEARGVNRWRQSKRDDHRDMSWGEVLSRAGGMVQVLP